MVEMGMMRENDPAFWETGVFFGLCMVVRGAKSPHESSKRLQLSAGTKKTPFLEQLFQNDYKSLNALPNLAILMDKVCVN